MKQNEKRFINIFHILFMIALAAIFLWFFIAQKIYPSEQNSQDYYVSELNYDWFYIGANEERVPMTVPGKCDSEKGEAVVFERELPSDIASNHWLCFRTSRQDMRVFINGELRDSFSTKDTRPFGLASASTYLFVELKDTDSSALLTVETVSDSTYSGVMRSVLYGDKMGILLTIFSENVVPLFLAGLICLLSIASIVLSYILKYIYKREISLLYLGWCMFAVSIWIISQSKLRQIFAPNVSATSAFSQFILFLIPIPFAFYVNCLQEYRYKKLFLTAEIVTLINFITCTALTALNIKDQADLTSTIYAILALLVFLIIYTIVEDYKKGFLKKYSIVLYGIAGILFFGFLQALQSLNKSSLENGHLLCIGLTFLLIMAGVQAVYDVMNSEKEKQQALYASEARAKFLASMSHEIRTPINAVLGIDEMIAKETNEAHIREYAEDIQTAGRNLLAIINDILDYSKIESGKMSIVKMEYDLASVINDSCNMVRIRAEKKGLTLKIDCDQKIPSRLYGDEIRIRQVLINLLTNAVKYTNKGTVTLTVRSEASNDSDINLICCITDTGIGIKAESIPILFDSFSRVDDADTHQIEGSGLGLTIVKELVELMNGSISVESTYGSGSKFTVTIPQRVISYSPIGNLATALTRNEQASIEDNFMAPGARVLIVDDVPMNLKVFCGLLKDTLIDIDTAESGREALSLIESNSYDLIFLDHMMPDLNGVETLTAIRNMNTQKKRHTPIIMLTANAILGAKEDYLKMGFDDYLSKPIQKDKLLFLIRKFLPEDLLLSKEAAVTSPANITSIDEITFLNTKQGLAYHSNDLDFYMEILHAYHEDDRLPAIQNHYHEKDWKNYQIMVHALSSSSKLIGAEVLSVKAKELELAIKREDIDYVRAHHTETMTLYKELQYNLSKLFSPVVKTTVSHLDAFSVLIVDDDKLNLMTAHKILEPYFTVTSLETGADALEYVNHHFVDLILLDIHMPQMDGFQVIEILKANENTKHIPVIFLTADSDSDAELSGFKAGAMDFIRKPFVPDIMLERINRVLELDKLQQYLQKEVQRNSSKVEKLSLQTMMTLAQAIDAKDTYTKGHSTRVAIYAKKIARKLGMSATDQDTIYFTGLLHDIGKIGVPDTIINKPGKLTDEEFAMVKRHPEIGYDILKNIAEIPNIEASARWHHERMDGKGYPDGLMGEQIPKFVRIISVADSYDAMSSKRSYREMLPQDYIINELEKGKGTQFDPEVAEAMIQLIKEDGEYMMKGV